MTDQFTLAWAIVVIATVLITCRQRLVRHPPLQRETRTLLRASSPGALVLPHRSMARPTKIRAGAANRPIVTNASGCPGSASRQPCAHRTLYRLTVSVGLGCSYFAVAVISGSDPDTFQGKTTRFSFGPEERGGCAQDYGARTSKYPPAKTEALFVEPLKAAEGPLPRPMVSESSYVDVIMPNSCAGPAACLGRANTVRHSGGDFLLAVSVANS